MASRLLILTVLVLRQAGTADTGIGGSILGFLFDPAHGLQPILGIAGASTIGAPLTLNVEIATVSISPQQDYAVASTAADASLLQIALGDPMSIRPLGIPISTAGLRAISPTGAAAAFYDRERRRIQVVVGLPAAANPAGEIDLSAFDGTLASLAVSDDAGAVLAIFSDGVAAMSTDGNIKLITAVERATAAKFLSKSRDAVIADAAADAVYLVSDVAGSPETSLLAGGIPGPAAVAVSSDNKRVFAASALSRSVAAIDMAGGGVTVVACPCEPTGLASLAGKAVFRLTEPTGGPIWLFDGDGPEPRIVFVPPYRPATEDSAR